MSFHLIMWIIYIIGVEIISIYGFRSLDWCAKKWSIRPKNCASSYGESGDWGKPLCFFFNRQASAYSKANRKDLIHDVLWMVKYPAFYWKNHMAMGHVQILTQRDGVIIDPPRGDCEHQLRWKARWFSGWWFGTLFPMYWESSSQLTFMFFRGVDTTSVSN